MDAQTPLYIAIFITFIAGLLSFFSPCILPLIPVYMAYLAGGASVEGQNDTSSHKLIVNTLLFVLGIGTTFVLLGLAASGLTQTLSSYTDAIRQIGGVLIIFFGLIELGVFGKSAALNSEHRLPFHFESIAMNPFVAYLFGLFFSFAWTPCVGPILASVIVFAGTSSTFALSMVLILFYTLGLSIPFILISLGADRAVRYFKAHTQALAYTTRISAVILIVVGLSMVLGWFGQAQTQDNTSSEPTSLTSQIEDKAPDFTLNDMDGATYTLSELEGKVVVVNFWAPWCKYCVEEMPDFENVYKGLDSDDVVMLGVVEPGYDVDSVLEKTGVTYPNLLDENGEAFRSYQVQSLPTTVVIDRQGRVMRRITGATSKDDLSAIIEVAKVN